jgi:hypothetical protein
MRKQEQMKKNAWVTTNRTYGSWRMTFPALTGTEELEHILAFTQQLLLTAEQYEVFRFTSSSVTRYIEHIRAEALKTGSLPLCRFSFLAGKRDEDFPFESKVCYYKDGEVIQTWVNDLGGLLAQLRNTEPLWETLNVHPVTLYGSHSPVGHTEDAQVSEAYISTCLPTDIWFPFVTGYMLPGPGFPYLRDNRELAHCHTPRLNQFLEQAKELTLKAGGTWNFETADIQPACLPMLTDTGIRLIDKPADGYLLYIPDEYED